HPDMPPGAEEGILKGMYLLEDSDSKEYKVAGAKPGMRVRMLGSGTILREVRAAAALLRKDYKINVDVWSATSINQLARDGMAVERWNMLHPAGTPRVSYVQECLQTKEGPVIAATDYMKMYA